MRETAIITLFHVRAKPSQIDSIQVFSSTGVGLGWVDLGYIGRDATTTDAPDTVGRRVSIQPTTCSGSTVVPIASHVVIFNPVGQTATK